MDETIDFDQYLTVSLLLDPLRRLKMSQDENVDFVKTFLMPDGENFALEPLNLQMKISPDYMESYEDQLKKEASRKEASSDDPFLINPQTKIQNLISEFIQNGEKDLEESSDGAGSPP